MASRWTLPLMANAGTLFNHSIKQDWSSKKRQQQGAQWSSNEGVSIRRSIQTIAPVFKRAPQLVRFCDAIKDF